MNLPHAISQLLIENDCIIIPDFGGFLSKRIPASNDLRNLEFTPPCKKIVFNENLKNNDGILVDYIAKIEDISKEQALVEINIYIETLKKDLNSGIHIQFGNLGTFNQQNDQIVFIFSEIINLLKSSYGLQRFNFSMLKTAKEVSIKKVQTVIAENKPRKKNRLVYYIISTAAVISGFLFIGFYTDLFETTNNQQTANIANFSLFESECSPKKMIIEDLSSEVEINELEIISTDEIIKTNIIEKELIATHEVTNTHRTHIIAGSFSSKQNAEKLRQELISSGYKSQIFPAGNGMYRVSVKSYPNQNSAYQDLPATKTELSNDELWVCNI